MEFQTHEIDTTYRGQVAYVLAKIEVALLKSSPDIHRARKVLEAWERDLNTADDDDGTPLELLGLPPRITQNLYDLGIISVEQLRDFDPSALMKFRNLGPFAVNLIREKLANLA